MGLDITYCENIKLYEGKVDEDGEPMINDYVRVYENPDFKNHCEHNSGYYTTNYSNDFRAGSYSGYGYFRNKLAGIMGYEYSMKDHSFLGKTYQFKDHVINAGDPFEELINFSDCEGAIGTIYSKKLYEDFKNNHQFIFDQLGLDDDHDQDTKFVEVYVLFMEAFRVASNNGVVIFH